MASSVKATHCYHCGKKALKCSLEDKCPKCEVRKKGECKNFFEPAYDNAWIWLCKECSIKWARRIK